MVLVVIPTVYEKNDPTIVSLVEELNSSKTSDCDFDIEVVSNSKTTKSKKMNEVMNKSHPEGSVFVFMDDDVLGIRKGFIDKLTGPFFSDKFTEKPLMVGPVLCSVEGKFPPRYSRALLAEREYLNVPGKMISGACFAIQDLGVRWDESLDPLEDLDFCLTLSKKYKSGKMYLCTSASIMHKHEGKTSKFSTEAKLKLDKKWNFGKYRKPINRN